MTNFNLQNLDYVWNKQSRIPVAWRSEKKGEKLTVRVPFAKDNRIWLQNGRRSNPAWSSIRKCWDLPKAWFNDFVERALKRYGQVYIIQPYREYEICAPACMNATGHQCQCSCLGANHGAGIDGRWFEVSDAFAIKWGNRDLAIRLMKTKFDL